MICPVNFVFKNLERFSVKSILNFSNSEYLMSQYKKKSRQPTSFEFLQGI